MPARLFPPIDSHFTLLRERESGEREKEKEREREKGRERKKRNLKKKERSGAALGKWSTSFDFVYSCPFLHPYRKRPMRRRLFVFSRRLSSLPSSFPSSFSSFRKIQQKKKKKKIGLGAATFLSFLSFPPLCAERNLDHHSFDPPLPPHTHAHTQKERNPKRSTSECK